VPSTLSLSVVQVIRAGVIHRLPSTFLVEGDLVRLHYGEVAPARVRLVSMDGEPAEPGLVLERGDCLFPSLLPPRKWSVYHPPHFDFVCLTTPLCASLADTLRTVRPTPVMENQRDVLHRLIVHRWLPALLAVSLLVNVLRIVLVPRHGPWVGPWKEHTDLAPLLVGAGDRDPVGSSFGQICSFCSRRR
jgi:hypothetical protein